MLLLVVLKTLFIMLLVVVGFAPIVAWVERKQNAIMQDRIGAKGADAGKVTALESFYPLADVIELLEKEDVVPAGANRLLYLLAPLITAVSALVAFAVIPYGGVYQFGNTVVSLVVADIDWGVLYIFAIGSLAAYAAVISGWASNDDSCLLRGVRYTLQMISYAVAMGLSIVGLFMVFGTLKLTDMAMAQDASFRIFGFIEDFGLGDLPVWLAWMKLPYWGIFVQPLGFLMFLSCIMAANRRPPFDPPESESGLAAGSGNEYSGMRFGLVYTSEFVGVVVIAGLCSALFLGAWAIPYLSQDEIISGLEPILGLAAATSLCMVLHVGCFVSKLVCMIWLQMLIRWSMPRLRYDQVMDLSWKIILPLSLANVFVTALLMIGIGVVE
jgi:NADH-quinone oxidoreductase subunit H